MRVLADENCERDLVLAMRAQGWDVAYVAEDCPGTSDGVVLEMTARSARILLTQDNDYGAILRSADVRPPAIVTMRLGQLRVDARIARMIAFFENSNLSIAGNMCVVVPGHVRYRPLPER